MSDRKQQALSALEAVGVVAVLRTAQPVHTREILDAVGAGGLRHVEITMTTPGALEIIRDLRAYRPDMYVGVGTVLDAATARLAILAGADYVVCPVFDRPTIDVCRQYSVAVMPGGLTPSEVANAWNAGADIVKVFPGRIATPEYIADLKAPLPHIKMMPTMEMTPEKACAYIRAGAVGIGVGSSIFDPEAMAAGRFGALTEAARSFVEAVSEEIRGRA